MRHESVITAPTMAQALAKVRRELGADAFILSHEESNGSVRITACIEDEERVDVQARVARHSTTSSAWLNQLPVKNKQPSTIINSASDEEITNKNTDEQREFAAPTARNPFKPIDIPTRRKDLEKPSNKDVLFDEALTAIGAVCDLSDYHQLGDELGETWLHALNPEFSKPPITLTPAFNRIIPHESNGLDYLLSQTHIILVGSPGCGKTVTTAKLAAMLLDTGKRVRVVTLDTLKSSGSEQLAAYLTPLQLKLHIGSHHLLNEDTQEITLIDTPALNIRLKEDRDYLAELKAHINTPLTLIIPADMNPLEVDEIAFGYHSVGAESLIVTRLDLVTRYGTLLRATQKGLTLLLTSQSPQLAHELSHISTDSIFDEMVKLHKENQ